MISDRIELLLKLKNYILENDTPFQEVKLQAERMNGWFTQEFINKALDTICNNYLEESELIVLASQIIPVEEKNTQMKIGITMAGNIPLVGFHDFLCVFLSGHPQFIKLSTKDEVLLKHFILKLQEWDSSLKESILISDFLKGCNAYIATGSNNSARYFEKYFANYPHIIRRNRSSVAILTGEETTEELLALADDIYMYFGLGCRNVTQIYVPKGYSFEPLLQIFKKYEALQHHNKYRNNIDYNLAVFILNQQYYMSNDSLLMIENDSIFSAIGVLHYSFYTELQPILTSLQTSPDVQAIIGRDYIPFGKAQLPSLFDFADGVNTIEFLNNLN